MNFKHFIYTLAIMALIFNCSSSSNDDLTNPDPDPDPQPVGEVTYEADVKSIISNNCLQCHGTPPTNNAPMSLSTYTQVKNNINTIISRINSSTNPMPPTGQMSSSLRATIQQWKDDGLLEN